MSSSIKRVVKIGGSLLNLPDLPGRLESWLSQQPPALNLLIVGGGEPVDQLRRGYLSTPHDEVALHWQCIDWMDQNATTLANYLPEFEVCDSLPNCEAKHKPAGWVLRPRSWLETAEPRMPGTKLRWNWDVSSDSIAARIAVVWQADTLILLKSQNPPGDDLYQLAELGYVDAMFPVLREEMPPCEFINLRGTASLD